MKVSPPPLNERSLRHHVRSFQIGELVASRGAPAGALGMAYDINTTRGRYVMRLESSRPLADARFEEALLGYLGERAFPVAQLLRGRSDRGSVAVSKTVELSLFHQVPGRPLAAFEVTPEHARQVGAFLAAMHVATRNFRRVRRSRATPALVARTLERMLKRTLSDELARDSRILGLELVRHLTQRRLPRGIVHGDLFVNHARFVGGELRSVLGFGGAASGSFASDVAIALVDWGFGLDTLQIERAAALVHGYESVRPLEPGERGGLYDLTCFAATRCAIMHMATFEVGPRTAPSRYRDYRHFMRRLDALRSFGAQHFRDKILGRAARER